MKKWGYAIISIGCIFIASAPLTDQPITMILPGLLISFGGLLLVLKK